MKGSRKKQINAVVAATGWCREHATRFVAKHHRRARAIALEEDTRIRDVLALMAAQSGEADAEVIKIRGAQ